jgi:hypothetical protein
LKVVKGQQQLTSITTTLSFFRVPTTIVIVEDGDGVAITSFGTKEKVIKVGNNVEMFFFHVITIVVKVGNNFGNDYLCIRNFFWTNNNNCTSSFGSTTILTQTSSRPTTIVTQVFSRPITTIV